MHCTWARSPESTSDSSPSTIAPVANAWATSGRLADVDDRADQVVGMDGLAGGGSHLAQHHRAVLTLTGDGSQQQEVREREVGQHLPRRHQPLHVA
jgi:hypothetical protein